MDTHKQRYVTSSTSDAMHVRVACVAVAMVLLTMTTASISDSSQWRLAKKLLRGFEREPPPGGSVNVSIGVYINYFYEISEQTMDYSLSMYIRQQWYDARLSFDPQLNNNSSKIKMPDMTWNKIWVPDVYFRNEVAASFHSITTPNRLIFVHSDGRVWYVKKITAKLSCPMLLHKYPLDTQGCPMVFSSFDYPVSQLVLRWITPKDRAVQFDPGGEDRSQFTIQGFHLNDCSYNSTQGAFSCLEAVFIVSRNLGFFLIQFYIPIIISVFNLGFFLIQFYIPSVLLVILSWISFWISVDAVVARVNIGLLTVLTLTTQSTGSGGQLPRVSYIKAIDVWMSTCLVFAFASLIEFALVNVWSRREARRKMRGRRPPSVGHGFKTPEDFPLQQMNRQLGLPRRQTTLQVPDYDSVVTSLLPPGEDKPNERRPAVSLTRRLSMQLPHMAPPRPVEHASSIDRLSRVIFPVCFVIFNVGYWLYYVYVV